jgi:hypothetical protein
VRSLPQFFRIRRSDQLLSHCRGTRQLAPQPHPGDWKKDHFFQCLLKQLWIWFIYNYSHMYMFCNDSYVSMIFNRCKLNSESQCLLKPTDVEQIQALLQINHYFWTSNAFCWRSDDIPLKWGINFEFNNSANKWQCGRGRAWSGRCCVVWMAWRGAGTRRVSYRGKLSHLWWNHVAICWI